MKKIKEECPYEVMIHIVGTPEHIDSVLEEATEILEEKWENGEVRTEEEVIKEVNLWSELGNEKERRLYVRRFK